MSRPPFRADALGRLPCQIMSTSRQLLAYGAFSTSERRGLQEVAAASNFELYCAESPEAAAGWLDTQDVGAMLLDGEFPNSDAFAIERRAESRHAALPVLIVKRTVDDLAFAEAFSWGGDDVIQRDRQHPLLARLRHLPQLPPPKPNGARGTALIAEADARRRIVVGRVLRNAGYSVTFAVSTDDLETYVTTQKIDCVVTSAGLFASPRSLIERAVQAGSAAMWIYACPPRDLRRVAEELSGLERVTCTDAFAPAENVLFVANELGRQSGTDNRSSARLLYGTTVWFRDAGRESDDLGYTYNLSAGGLYVRTLAPPEEDICWLELLPPRSERRVRLVGRIAWRRWLERGEFATVPPGFGVEIIDGSKADLAAWEAGYRAFAKALV